MRAEDGGSMTVNSEVGFIVAWPRKQVDGRDQQNPFSSVSFFLLPFCYSSSGRFLLVSIQECGTKHSIGLTLT